MAARWQKPGRNAYVSMHSLSIRLTARATSCIAEMSLGTSASPAMPRERMLGLTCRWFCAADARSPWQIVFISICSGGAAAAMFDTSMGMTVLAFMDCQQAATTDLSVSYIRPFTGNSFIFRTELLHPGKSLVRIRAIAEDETSGKTLASATANFVYKK